MGNSTVTGHIILQHHINMSTV